MAAVLGAHSQIIAAGEVRWLVEKNNSDFERLIESSKRLTKENSVPWQSKTFENASYSNVYKKIFDAFNSNCLVNSSKEPCHFQNIINHAQDNGTHFLFISLWKHPIRLLSSQFIKYEDIVENLETTLQRILDEIQLEYEDGMGNYEHK